jgi:hypothetical protein
LQQNAVDYAWIGNKRDDAHTIAARTQEGAAS